MKKRFKVYTVPTWWERNKPSLLEWILGISIIGIVAFLVLNDLNVV